MNSETKFEVGDQVEWCGVLGIVTGIDGRLEQSIQVVFNESLFGEECRIFYPDGKYEKWHTEPSLRLISKAKKKRKVKLYAFFHKNTFVVSGGYGSIQYAVSEMEIHNYIRVPELDKEVEIEE